MVTIIHVEGMSCGHCVKAVSDCLLALDGVNDVSVDLAQGLVTVKHSDAATLEIMENEIEEAGYEMF